MEHLKTSRTTVLKHTQNGSVNKMQKPKTLEEWLALTPEQRAELDDEIDREIKEHPQTEEEEDLENHEAGYFENDEDD